MAAPTTPSTYTYQVKPRPTEPGVLNYFANLQRDGSKQPLTGVLGNGFMTQDANSSPTTSPVTVATNSVTTIYSPLNAVSITITPVGHDVLVSEALANASLTSWSSNYIDIPAGTTQTIEIADQQTIYLLGLGTAPVTSFYFSIV